MKKIGTLTTTLFLALAGFYGCVENDIQNIAGAQNGLLRPQGTGVSVSFDATQQEPTGDAATAKFFQELQAQGTRTSYTDWRHSGEIRWSAGDRISIVQVAMTNQGVMTENNALKAYDYQIPEAGSGRTTSDIDYSFRNGQDQRQQNDTEMEWYAGASSYHFMATYPTISSAAHPTGIISVEPAQNGNQLDINTRMNVQVKVQKQQTVGAPTRISANKQDFLAAPDMTNNYMVGWQKNHQDGFTRYGETVQILFKPVMTCLWVKVRGAANNTVGLNGIRVQVYSGNSIVQIPDKITLSCQTMNYAPGHTDVTCTNIKETFTTGEGNQDIYVRFANTFTIPAKGSVVIPVYLPPLNYKANAYSLRILPDFADGTNATLPHINETDPLANERLRSEMQLMYNIFKKKDIANTDRKIILPGTRHYEALSPVQVIAPWEWMKYINDESPIKNLSIPGAHRALADIRFEKLWWENMRKPEQSWNIRAMMEAGIRALDLPVSTNAISRRWVLQPSNFGGCKPAVDSDWGAGGDNNIALAYRDGSYPRNDRKSDGSPRYEINHVIEFLEANPTETIIMLMTREPVTNGSYGNIHKTYDAFIKNLLNERVPTTQHNGKNRPNAGASLVVPFTDNLKMKDCRGRIILILRPEPKENSYAYLDGENLPTSVGGVDKNWCCPSYNNRSYHHNKDDNGWAYTYNYYEQNYLFGKYDDRDVGDRPAGKTTKIYPGGYNNSVGVPANAGFFYCEIIGRAPGGSGSYNTDRFRTINKTYRTFDELTQFHAIWAVDFLRRTMYDGKSKSYWMFNVIPGLAVKGSNMAEDESTLDGNTWTRSAEFITPPVYNFLKENMGKRAGIIFYDYCPGITWQQNAEGQWYPQYHVGVSNKYNTQGTKYDAPSSRPPFTPAAYLTNLLIRNNFLYDTTK